MENTRPHGPVDTAVVVDRKHSPANPSNAAFKGLMRVELEAKPISIHLLRDGKIAFDDLRLLDVSHGPLKGRGEKAQANAQQRMLVGLYNTDIGRYRGDRCRDITRVVHTYYGGPDGVAAAMRSATPAEREAAARFLNLTAHRQTSPLPLNLQFESIADLNRGVQAVGAVIRSSDRTADTAADTVGQEALAPAARIERKSEPLAPRATSFLTAPSSADLPDDDAFDVGTVSIHAGKPSPKVGPASTQDDELTADLFRRASDD